MGRAVEAAILIAVPATLVAAALFDAQGSAALTFVVVVGALALFFADYEGSQPALRQIMPTVVLAAFAAAGRILFAAIPDFKPVSALCIVAGSVFGRKSGFIVGAIAALVSNFFFGQGPWTPWQMYGAFERTGALLAFGFLSGWFYGLLLNGWYVIGFVHPITWQSVLLAYAAGFPLDTVHGAATVVFLLALYVPLRRKLLRIKRKFALV